MSQSPHAAQSARGRATFPCRIALEDVCISVLADSNKQVSLAKSRWEELRVSAEYDGVTQKTRWLALPHALELRHSSQTPAPNGDDDSVDSSLDMDENDAEKKSDEDSARTPNVPPSVTSAGMTRLKERCVEVSFSALNNSSFIAWFNADTEAKPNASENASNVEDSAASLARPKVKPKKVHFFAFTVEGSNENRIGSLTGGLHSNRKPTSANKEAFSAAASKGAAKVSAWAKNTFLKLSSRSSAEEANKKKAEDAAARQLALAAYEKQHSEDAPSKLIDRGDYLTVISGVDPSEAYNAPDGRKRFQLLLKPRSSKVPVRGIGVPFFISFTMAAKFAEEQPVAVPRNFHSMVVVMDQVVLDLTDAAATMELPGHNAHREKDEAPAHVISGYGFGLTSNSVVCDGQPTMRSAIVDSAAIHTAEGSKVRSINFGAQHQTANERELTAEDFTKLPTSVCIVSASCVEGNHERVGKRRVTISRFKTSPTDGLCKPSFKCQLLLFLRRRLSSGEIIEEPANQAIDLASILNEEYYPPHVRQVRFSAGELIYVRLCRYCFAEPERYCSPLLMPYDFDNDGVQINSESNEVVAEWILEANARHRTVGAPPKADEGASASSSAIHPQHPPQQQQQTQQQQQPSVSKPEAVAPPPRRQEPLPPPPREQTMEERMGALGRPSPQTKEDSPPTPPLNPDNPFLTQLSTTYTPQHEESQFTVNPFHTEDSTGTSGAAREGGTAGFELFSQDAAPSSASAQPAPVNGDDDFFGDYGSGGEHAANAPAFTTGEGDATSNQENFFTAWGAGPGAEDKQQDQPPSSAAREGNAGEDDFFGDWGSGAGATGVNQSAPGFEITPAPGEGDDFWSMAAADTSAQQQQQQQQHAPVEQAGYFFGDHRSGAFEITPMPGESNSDGHH